jgi:hypothetical protein
MQLFIKEKGIVTRTNESRENCWSGDQQELEGLKEIKDSTKRENSQAGRPDCVERGPVFSKRISNIISKKE